MQEFLLKLSKKQKIGVGVCVLLAIFIIFIFLYQYFYAEENKYETDTKNVTNEIENNIEAENQSLISIGIGKNNVIVHVIGEVNNPGVVTLNEGARIIDAINEAGGKTEDADLSKINLAYIVEDGVQIYVPRIGEKREEYIIEDAGEGIIADSATLENNETKDTKVNINTANVDKLQSLPGIGVSTAQKIIDYRIQNGKFKTIEDIKNVPGIGEAKYNSLKDQIIV